jgi:hypothetical protein
MNSDPGKSTKRLWPLLLCGILVGACGGGSSGGGGSSDSAGVGGTGVSTAKGVVKGKVTDFGSIYVNGVEFDTDSSSFLVDGNADATQSDLAIGMVVTLEVETLDGAYTGKAYSVVYDDEVQGPVSAAPAEVPGSGGARKTFSVFGQLVTIDDTETVFKGTSFTALDANDVVEISGFRSSDMEIFASFVERKGSLMIGSEVELRGTISGYTPPTQQFMLDGVPITFDNNTEIELESGGLANGLYVEVEGIYQAGPSLYAEKIEEEDNEFGGDVEDLNLQGLVSNYVSISNFRVSGQIVDASQAKLAPQNAAALLANGVEVKVQGALVAGVLVADELELRTGDTRLRAFVFSVNLAQNRFRVSFTGLPGTIRILVNSQTLFDDEGPLELPNFSLADMNAGDFVRVEGTESGGNVVAETVKRLDATDPDDGKIEGRVDAFVPNISITVLGIPFNVDSGTEYKDEGGDVAAAVFFGELALGDRVEIEDKVVADGIAEKVELDD